ncbi:MAG: helix-turn-helix domain-containing protein [Planctomycetes bacterium]|nr:helix-turn-helix domain-containing protein [Planctomycetota bacterium]
MVERTGLTVAEEAGGMRVGVASSGSSPLGEPLVDAATVAAFLGVDKTTVYRLAATTALPSIDVAPRVVRFRPQDVRDYVLRRTRKAVMRGRVQQLLRGSFDEDDSPERN